MGIVWCAEAWLGYAMVLGVLVLGARDDKRRKPARRTQRKSADREGPARTERQADAQ
ncbi:MAG: hypothetical protein HYU66_03625 [Armatimonadetes bacterium]|nr:hypothetical protein [Armatimonadota bacterium]